MGLPFQGFGTTSRKEPTLPPGDPGLPGYLRVQHRLKPTHCIIWS